MSQERHFNPVELRLCWEALPSPERQLVDHLLGCGECRGALALEIESHRLAQAPQQGSEPPAYLGALDEVLVRREDALVSTFPQVAQEQAESALLIDELCALPAVRWPELFMAQPPAAFLRLVLDEAARILPSDPDLADTLARHVRNSVPRQSGGLPGTLASEILARGWAITGGARTRRGQWVAADAAFEEASRELSRVSDLDTEAELCRFMADGFVRRDRLTEAQALLEHAARLSEAGGQAVKQVGELGELARLLSKKGDLDQAAGALARALLLAEDQGLEASAAQLRLHLTWILRQAGRHDDAHALAAPAVRRAVGRAAELVVEAFDPLLRREVTAAEALLLPAFSAALLEGDAILAAIAVLNLIGLYVVEERSAKLREIAPQVGLLADAEADLTPASPCRARGFARGLAFGIGLSRHAGPGCRRGARSRA